MMKEPSALHTMSEKELDLLSCEIRDFLVEQVSRTGGHIASNLGVVELTLALHSVFDSPRDRILWDVGHQSYVHKILTGRADQFHSLRQNKGLSGFPKRQESVHDHYDTGHASNSISAALGMAFARDLAQEDHAVIAVIGDGALTGGIAYEALNHAGHSGTRIIVILNDNGMSIGKNTGGMSQHLNRLRGSQTYLGFKKQLKMTLQRIPKVGPKLYEQAESIRDVVKYAFVPGAIFEELGFHYFGPIDGHNLHDLREILKRTRHMDGPVLLHVITKKGKGYPTAERHPERFHGIGPFDPETGTPLESSLRPTYSGIFGNKLLELGKEHSEIVAVSAAMVEATGLSPFAKAFPHRCFDVGIAEQHAVSFAAGLAIDGYRPVVAIYSTFLQRAYDQILEDVCLHQLPVLFAIDRAGIVGADGETHQGIYDISYLSGMPNMTILSPKDGRELEAMMEYALTLQGPCAIRYPRGEAPDLSSDEDEILIDGRAELVLSGDVMTLIAAGRSFYNSLLACEMLAKEGVRLELINSRFIKPLDADTLLASGEKTRSVLVVEDHTICGGLGSAVEHLFSSQSSGGIQVHIIGWPDQFIPHGSVKELEQEYGMDPQGIAAKVRELIERKT